MITIAVDAMGGDHAPDAIVKGIAEAAQENEARYILVGDSGRIEPLARHCGIPPDRFEILHTPDSVSMKESPGEALKEKPGASIALTAKILAEDKADALLSAGNTGAVILAAKQYIPMIEGVERSALATVYPTMNVTGSGPDFSSILDVGATLHCDARHLVHFALMGHNYMKNVLGVSDPRIGLLNIGTEPSKGGHVLTQAYKSLSEIPAIHFAGNIEGRDIPRGVVDVVVCEGMIGNILIKMMEGAAESLIELGKYAYKKKLVYKMGLALLSSGIKKVRKHTDYAEYGGAPIVGFHKLCIKAHGRSSAKAVRKAVSVAVSSVENELCKKIKDSVRDANRYLTFENE
ncbi:phosphate acyltransferase PlsX [candidate division KSB1 bacterium]